MRSKAELENDVAEAGSRAERHYVEMAMLRARTDAIRRLEEAEVRRWRKEMVAASPSARKRLAELEREDSLRLVENAKRVIQMRAAKPQIVARKAVKAGR